MIFIGDIALPGGTKFETSQFTDVFNGEPIVANLEGPIVEDGSKHLSDKKLFSSRESMSSFKNMGVCLFSGANNHITDVEQELNLTSENLGEMDIGFVGAGDTLNEASAPFIFNKDEERYVFLAFGWEAIQCRTASKTTSGVNPLKSSHVFNSISEVKKKYPNSTLVVMMHWNYELEVYPQPRDRQLARNCIDLGVDAVIGSHSHCVQGIEIYKGAPIVYSLGNWFIPQEVFFAGKLRFPSFTCLQLAFEWIPEKEPVCHWFKYNPEQHAIKYLKSETLSESSKVKELTPYCNYSHGEYIAWFKKNRIQRLLLPVFKNVDDTFVNYIKIIWVKLRGRLIDLLLSLGLKKIRSGV